MPEDDRRIQIRSVIDQLELAMRRDTDSGVLRQTIYEGGTDRGDSQCCHYFGDDVYVRTLLIPAGTCVIGRLHLQARVCMILSGECIFFDEFQYQHVSAPWVGSFERGTKTVVYAVEDTLWAACVGTPLTDPKTAFYQLTAADHDEYARYLEKLL